MLGAVITEQRTQCAVSVYLLPRGREVTGDVALKSETVANGESSRKRHSGTAAHQKNNVVFRYEGDAVRRGGATLKALIPSRI